MFMFSKKHGSCETSSFRSEFISMKSCCENLRGLRFNLRTFGTLVACPAYVLGNNQHVLSNSSKPRSDLKKKSSIITYNFSPEGGAKNEWRTSYLTTHLDPSDICTKSLLSFEKIPRFTGYLLLYLE